MGEFRRNIEDLVNDPKGYLAMLADRLNNTAKGRKAVINDQGAGYRNLTREEKMKQAQDAALDNIGGGGLGIIKSKGGNWLTGSVENALSGLKKGEGFHPGFDTDIKILPNGDRLNLVTGEVLDAETKMTPKKALNNWIDGALTKYVKRDMATEGDPVRKLAEQGVLHIQPEQLAGGRNYVHPTGDELRKLGVSDSAQYWENASDRTIYPQRVGNIPTKSGEEAWITSLKQNAPATEVYRPSSLDPIASNLGFTHLTDELSNALNPESGLPRHLQLSPEQMQQMGMEKAVRHVSDINAWRAAQQAEANLAKSQSPAVHHVREYADNNPKGLKWVELKAPQLPKDWVPKQEAGAMRYYDPEGVARFDYYGNSTPDEAFGYDTLEQQLKYEGDTMGHCVGGYCDDVAGGKSRIFSLRDAKGEPHVTIETRPGEYGGFRSIEDFKNALLAKGKEAPEGDLNSLVESGAFNPSIIQIKGKQNKKPNDEYLPFVQDFVKNHPEGGQWGDVGDLHNTGLRRTSDAWNTMEQSRIKAAGIDIPSHMTQEEIDAIEKQVWAPDGYAQGGVVHPHAAFARDWYAE